MGDLDGGDEEMGPARVHRRLKREKIRRRSDSLR